MKADLKDAISRRCREMEIPLVGVADVDRWEDPPFQPWMPEEFYPRSIYPEARSVIVVGLPISLPVLETSPSIYYRELYNTVNALLDQYTYRISNLLNSVGHPSIFVPRDGYGSIGALLENPVAFFSHRHAAYLSGLGSFGLNNMILTPEYGPRVRFGSILTTAELPSDPLMELELCTRCMRCVEMCPSRALSGEGYPDGLTDKMACAAYSARLNQRQISPCGICIKVCPVGEDRVFYERGSPSLYTDEDMFPWHHRAWRHVRSYGGRRGTGDV
ncbi:MAG: 4Fe-4S binding protein [Methanothrix sp.]|nr:4Fe-4S binding protein [Methanothrix sp.]